MTTQYYPPTPCSSGWPWTSGLERYIVALPDESTDEHVQNTAKSLGGRVICSWSAALKGFALEIPFAREEELRARERNNEFMVDRDTSVYLASSWAFDRIRRKQPCDPIGAWPAGAGRGVDLYIIDSGIASLKEFDGRLRVIEGCTGYQKETPRSGGDHGTAVAAVAASTDFGVATGASIFPVPVIPESGHGTVWNVIEGVNCVIRSAEERQRPSVALMALATDQPSRCLNHAVRRAIRHGITCVVAAGNGRKDISRVSPAGVHEAITVGALMRGECRYEWRLPETNDGEGVTFFAPGEAIQTLDAYGIPQPMSGTSVAAAIVAGVVALYLGTHKPGPYPTPKDIKDQLLDLAANCTIRNRKHCGKRQVGHGKVIYANFS